MRNFSFSHAPSVTMRRYPFDISHRVLTTLKVGKLTPIDVMEALPSDTYKVKCKYQLRLSTAFLRPVMDNFFLKLFHFNVPLRLLYEDYESVFGNTSPNAYVDSDLGAFPSFNGSISVKSGTVGDYLGLPVITSDAPKNGALPKNLSVLKFRAFALIYEEWFRNQNTVSPMLVQKGEIGSFEVPSSAAWSPSNYCGALPSINKFNDYFTAGLPAPQKGAPVSLGTAVLPAQNLPLFNSSDEYTPQNTNVPIKLMNIAGIPWSNGFHNVFINSGSSANNYALSGDSGVSPASAVGSPMALTWTNTYAALSEQPLSSINVNDLRFAVQLQKMQERDARGGSRYVEYLASHYGVRVADGLLQRPEYLGGIVAPLNLQQVVQTSKSETNAPLGDLGAYSRSLGQSRFTKGIVEHSYIMTVAAVVYKHSYQQGIHKSWFRTERDDFYDPLFATIGEQPTYTAQLYGYGQSEQSIKDTKGFNYNEAWAEYRYQPDVITGGMRSGIANSFDIWHFGDYYESEPYFTQEFTEETPKFFRRTTALSTANVDDFLAEFYFTGCVYRSMPIHSIPSLLDHH